MADQLTRISARAYDLIRGRAIYEFKQTGRQLPDGSWEVPFSDDTLDRVEEVRLAGETLSDCLERILSTPKGAN